MAQNYYLVKDQENKATAALAQQYIKLQEWYLRVETTRAARKAYAQSIDVRFKQIQAGAKIPDIAFLDFQAKLATAMASEYTAIAEYNNSLARLEWTKGTILNYNNVHIAEGPVPQCTQIRAVEHEKERSKAIVLRERPDPLTHPARLAHTAEIPPMETPRPLPILEQPTTPLPGPTDRLEVLPQPAPSPAPQGPPPPILIPTAAEQPSAPALANPVVTAELTFKTAGPTASGAPLTLPGVVPAVGDVMQTFPELNAIPAPTALGNPR